MRLSGFAMGAALAAAAIALVPCAHAENWVDTGHAILIDVDSIHKESDGLVYYFAKDKYEDEDGLGPQREAVDCAKRIMYSSYAIQYEADWRSKGNAVNPGTMGEVLLDFVCTRVK